MHILWQRKKGKPYAYIRTNFWDKEKKSPRTQAVYLGGTLKDAEQKLKDHLSSGNMALPDIEKHKLINQLRETAPEDAHRPRRDIPLESTVKLLARQRDKYQGRPDITGPLEEALKTLEGLKEA